MIKDVTLGTKQITPTNAEKMIKLKSIKDKLLEFKYTGKVSDIKLEEIPF